MSSMTGRTAAVASTMLAFSNCTKEPTALSVIKAWRIPPTSGLLYQAPLAREPRNRRAGATR
jgi:hypothetical protein